jgi:hypothetical protein
MENSDNHVENHIEINVYPSEGMDEEALAEMVMDRMQNAVDRKAAAFG